MRLTKADRLCDNVQMQKKSKRQSNYRLRKRLQDDCEILLYFANEYGDDPYLRETYFKLQDRILELGKNKGELNVRKK